MGQAQSAFNTSFLESGAYRRIARTVLNYAMATCVSLAMGSALTAKVLSRDWKPVSLDLQPVSWWTQLSYGVQKHEVLEDPSPVQALATVASPSLVQKKIRKRVARTVRTTDQLGTTQAQPELSALATEAEKGFLLKMTLTRRAKFFLAMSTQSTVTDLVSIHVSTAGSRPARDRLAPQQASESRQPKQRDRLPEEAKAPAPREESLRYPEVRGAHPSRPTVQEGVAAQLTEIRELSVQNTLKNQLAGKDPRRSDLAQEAWVISTANPKSLTLPEAVPAAQASPVHTVAPVATLESKAAAKQEEGVRNQAYWVVTQGARPATAILPPAKGVSTQVLATQATPVAKVSTQSKTTLRASNTHLNDEQSTDPQGCEALTRTSKRTVEAFDWNQPIRGVRMTALSHSASHSEESSVSCRSDWRILSSEGFWKTLTWVSVAKAAPTKIPLVSDTTLRFLGLLGSNPQAPTAGLILGKIPESVAVEFSGRSEPVLYFSPERKVVNPDSPGEKYFVLLNAQPGAHLLYLRSTQGLRRAGVPAHVLASRTTYMDLSRPVVRNLEGVVLDASRPDARPMPGVTVRVVGQDQLAVVSDAKGKFLIRDWIQLGDAPVVLESDDHHGFVHRYQWRPDSNHPLQLFRMSETTIRNWANQLEGGLSPESGMVIATTQGLISQLAGRELFGKVHPMSNTTGLSPEAYTLLGNGELREQVPLSTKNPVAVGVQVPEGGNIFSIEDSAAQSVWNQLLVASPGVVNIVTPENSEDRI